MDLSRVPGLSHLPGLADIPIRTLKSIANLGGVFRPRAPRGARPDTLAPSTGAFPTKIHVLDYTEQGVEEWHPTDPDELRGSDQ